MIGIVLAAGGGTRLRPLTDDLPKTLLDLGGGRSILDVVVANLASVRVDRIVIVTGHGSAAIEARAPRYHAEYGVPIETRFNERYADRNNAYSLWLCRDSWAGGALLVNGDTAHAPAVEERLLAAGAASLVLAIDERKALGCEEMKVTTTRGDTVRRISKSLDPAIADGEYIGVARIGPDSGSGLAESLERAFTDDPARWYEDGFQDYIDHGARVGLVHVGDTPWIEVDDHDDLSRARRLRGLGGQ